MLHSPLSGAYPHTRLRRLRSASWIRDMVQETHLHPEQLIEPLFIVEGRDRSEPIAALPGVHHLSPDKALARATHLYGIGVRAIALFPVVDSAKKTNDGAEAWNPHNLMCRTIAMIKSALPDMGIIGDVALDPYTTHGHDGLCDSQGNVLNDASCELLIKQALTLAEAGCDVVAPSDMMDGRVRHIRAALESEGFDHTIILSYAAKYASHLYGPFREAVGSKGALGKSSKATYHMSASNGKEGLREAILDIQEGADIVMVKPAGWYHDVIFRIAQQSSVPVWAYQVSGEYAMLHYAAAQGMMDWHAGMNEALVSTKRAGASAIITYAAGAMAEWLGGQ